MVTPTAAAMTRDAGPAAPVLEVRGLAREFGRVPALSGLDLQVRRGEIHCLIGPNGSGKTTALSIIAGLAHATRGVVRVCGIDVRSDPARSRRHIGWLGQQPGFYRWMTGREVLQFTGRFAAPGTVRPLPRGDDLLELTGLSDAADRAVDQYSAGMCKRLGIARALLGRPDLLVLDEPSAGLDSVECSRVAAIFERLRGETSILFSSDGSGDLHRLAGSITPLPGNSLWQPAA